MLWHTNKTFTAERLMRWTQQRTNKLIHVTWNWGNVASVELLSNKTGRSSKPKLKSIGQFMSSRLVFKWVRNCSLLRSRMDENTSSNFRCLFHALAPSSGTFALWHRSDSWHCLTIWLFRGTMWAQMKPSMMSLSKSSFCEGETNVPSLSCTCFMK